MERCTAIRVLGEALFRTAAGNSDAATSHLHTTTISCLGLFEERLFGKRRMRRQEFCSEPIQKDKW
jgi:hypothetical protein